MSGGFILGHVLAGASHLMITFAFVARSTGVPVGHVVSTRVAVVVVVEPLIWVGR